MNDLDHINNFLRMSHEIGSNLAYVQGGGGNTSVKINDNFMYIKSSGVSLKDIDLESGMAKVDYKKVNDYHSQPDISDEKYTKSINNFSLTPHQRPSMETGFHALLGKYVIHSHSVFLNVFLCSNEGKDILLKHFPNAVWINYCTPGKDLTFQISKSIEQTDSEFEGLIFLENHGVISSASSYKKCLKLHNDSNEKIKSFYNLNNFNLINKTLSKPSSNFLFPDQVIYMSEDELNKNTQALHETISTVHYLEEAMNNLSLSPKYLSKTDIKTLNSMQSEKYRKQISK